MSALSTDTLTSNLGDAADAIRSTLQGVDLHKIDISSVTDSLDDASSFVSGAAADLVDLAGSASVAGSRALDRTTRQGSRLVRQHPRVSIAALVAVVAVVGVFVWSRRNAHASYEQTELKMAA